MKISDYLKVLEGKIEKSKNLKLKMTNIFDTDETVMVFAHRYASPEHSFLIIDENFFYDPHTREDFITDFLDNLEQMNQSVFDYTLGEEEMILNFVKNDSNKVIFNKIAEIWKSKPSYDSPQLSLGAAVNLLCKDERFIKMYPGIDDEKVLSWLELNGILEEVPYLPAMLSIWDECLNKIQIGEEINRDNISTSQVKSFKRTWQNYQTDIAIAIFSKNKNGILANPEGGNIEKVLQII